MNLLTITIVLQTALASHGLLDAEVRNSEHTLVMAYENRAFRSDVAAMGTALGVLGRASSTHRRWTLVPTRWGVPLLYVNIKDDRTIHSCRVPEIFEHRLGARGNPNPDPPLPGSTPSTQGISSRGKVDLMLHSQFRAVFGEPGDPFRVQVCANS